ncbi:MAG: CRISPR-associated endonuclease Cas1 [Ruminococcus sp.]
MKQLRQTLYIMTPERYLSLDGENVVVQEKKTVLARLPLHNLDGIICFGATGASPPLMGKCAEMGLPISFLSRSGKFLCRTEGTTSGNVLLRRQQYRLADQASERLKIAKSMITGKIFNSRYVLERAIRDHGLRMDVKNAEEVRISASSTTSMGKHLIWILCVALKGSSICLFSVWDDLILQQKEHFIFCSFQTTAIGSVNALLSFAYSFMTSMCTAALESVGLDPYIGFLHTDRPGRRSLALDLVEEFRAPLCDRFVLTLINRRMIQEKQFEKQADGAVYE